MNLDCSLLLDCEKPHMNQSTLSCPEVHADCSVELRIYMALMKVNDIHSTRG